MMVERNKTFRSVTLKRPESDAPCRLKVSWENTKWEVEEPMSMPTLLSVNISRPSMSSMTASGPMSAKSGCSWSSSRSCMLYYLLPRTMLQASLRRRHTRRHTPCSVLVIRQGVNPVAQGRQGVTYRSSHDAATRLPKSALRFGA